MSTVGVVQHFRNGKVPSQKFDRPLTFDQKAQISKAIIKFKSKGLDNSPRLLALHMLHNYHNGKTGKLNPSQETLAGDFGIKARAIRTLLSNLEKHGIIEKERTNLPASRHKGHNRYRFNLPDQWTPQPGKHDVNQGAEVQEGPVEDHSLRAMMDLCAQDQEGPIDQVLGAIPFRGIFHNSVVGP